MLGTLEGDMQLGMYSFTANTFALRSVKILETCGEDSSPRKNSMLPCQPDPFSTLLEKAISLRAESK